jgi:hypothetical protein
MISLKQRNQFQFVNTITPNRRSYSLNSGFDDLFLLPRSAFASHKKFNLRRDLAKYNFHINIVANTPKGNVWICK